VVRKVGTATQLIAGERRCGAAKLALVAQVPVVVSDIPDDRLLEITLIENISARTSILSKLPTPLRAWARNCC